MGVTEFGSASRYSSISPSRPHHTHQMGCTCSRCSTFCCYCWGMPSSQPTTTPNCQPTGIPRHQIGFLATGWAYLGTALSAVKQGTWPPICPHPIALGCLLVVATGKGPRHQWHQPLEQFGAQILERMTEWVQCHFPVSLIQLTRTF